MQSASVEDVVEELDRAFNAGDLERVLEYYEADAVLVVEPGQVVSGKEDLRQAFERLLASGSSAKQDKVRVIQNGNLALFLSRWTLTTPTPNGPPIIRSFTATCIFRRGTDGQWRLAIDNSLGPLVLGP